MPEVKTIKDVDEGTWAEFKSMAARDRVKLGPFFKVLVNEHKKVSTAFWNAILKGEKILSDDEAEAMIKTVKRLRQEYGFRS